MRNVARGWMVMLVLVGGREGVGQDLELSAPPAVSGVNSTDDTEILARTGARGICRTGQPRPATGRHRSQGATRSDRRSRSRLETGWGRRCLDSRVLVLG